MVSPPHSRRFRFLALFFTGIGPSLAGIGFNEDVRPILSDRCFACHGFDANAREAGLRLDTAEGAFAKNDDGAAAIVPGDPAASLAWQRIINEDPDEVMPPPDSHLTLSKDEKELLRQWIAQGAEYEQHWAFTRVERPETRPDAGSPLDDLVARRLDRDGLEFAPEAERRTLIRRLSFDLRGLPPQPKEIAAFLGDDSPDAWEKLVDRFLADPAFGERMAWPWLDAARYADSNGYQNDAERTMWPWRDWVIDAFNRNLPYDDFTAWQIAGDLFPDATFEQKLATGFLRNHAINGEGGRIPEENRVDYIMDMSETVGTVWMALTLNCCRCHDHKYDPLSQKEYYGLFDFFNQTPVDGSGGNPQTPPALAVPSEDQRKRETELAGSIPDLERKLAARAAELAPAQGAWESKETGTTRPSKPALQKALAIAPDQRSKEQAALVRNTFLTQDPTYRALDERLTAERIELKNLREAVPKVMIMADREKRRDAFILAVGSYEQPGAKVVAHTPAVLPPLEFSAEHPNRLDLARWLVSRDHPLTARVTVNRLWQDFFGIGFIKTPEDFGVQSEIPKHQPALDWLAAEFMESGWDFKHLVRTIVTSRTYRQSSRVTPELLEKDPDNRLLARGPRFRLPAWMIRDQALAAGGLLVPEIGGPPVFPWQPPGLWAEVTFGGGKKTYRPDSGDKLRRRSIYTFWRRISAPPMFFDNAKREMCEVDAKLTNSPLHALATLNDPLYTEAARALAKRAWADGHTPSQTLAAAFEIALSRPPSDDEATALGDIYQSALTEFKAKPDDATAFLAIGETPRNENLTPVTEAALATVCLAIFNTDEILNKE